VPALLSTMPHGRVVNHAVFSPSGRQILTTCQDNRLRVWSNLLACDGPPTREIVHSHDFNRCEQR
jgi:DNA damage-binding protein 2